MVIILTDFFRINLISNEQFKSDVLKEEKNNLVRNFVFLKCADWPLPSFAHCVCSD